jgi:hypothetical protein
MGRSKKDAMKGQWMQNAVKPSHRGLLREKLHVPEGKNISMSKLDKAAHSKNPTLKKEAVLAETFRKFSK